jgi:hypothetical protein
MRFDIYEFRHIVGNIDDLLFMSGSDRPIGISVDRDGENQSDIFMKLSFSLPNGDAEIRVHQKQAFFIYLDKSGEILKKLEFDNSHVREIHGSFNTVLKQILIFDRQQSSISKANDSTIDRASFGLVEVN